MNTYLAQKSSSPVVLAGLIAGCSLASAAPIGINFWTDAWNPGGDVLPTESAFGVPAGNWVNARATHGRNPGFVQTAGPLSLTTADGTALTVSFNYGSLFDGSTGASAPPAAAELRILNQYIQNTTAASSAPGYSVTVSGLSAIPGGRYQVKLLGASRDVTEWGNTSGFKPVTLTAGSETATLTYSALSGHPLNPARANAAVAISSSSPVLTADSITLSSPVGSITGDGLAAILISPATDINSFDASGEVTDWEVLPTPSGTVVIGHSTSIAPRFVGGIQETPHAEGEWSTDVDADPASGSLMIDAMHSQTTNSQFNVRRNFAEPVDAGDFEALELDILFDPASVRRRFGNYSFFTVYLQYLDGEETREIEIDSFNTQGTKTNSQGGGIPGVEGNSSTYADQWVWQRVTAPLQTAAALPALSSITGIRLASTASGNSAPSGVAYVDNLRFVAPEAQGESPEPALAIEKADSGLLLSLTAADPEATLGTAEYQNVRVLPGDYTWIGKATAETPVTYSFTIEGYPGTPAGATGQFESHIFLVPAADDYEWSHNPNITHPHAVRLTLNGDATSAWAHLGYKIDFPDADGYWTTDNGLGGQLGSVGRPSVYGTWSLRFTADNVVTLVAPNGATQTWTIVLPDFTGVENPPPTIADAFAGPMAVYFGSGVRDAQGQHHLNARASSVFSNISITGVPTPVNESFTGPLDTQLYSLESSINPASVLPLAATESPFWVTWNSAATGYRLQESTTLDAWTDSETSILGAPGERQRVLKPSWLRPAGGKGFYRLTDAP
ncbi:hypothetical protein OKA04_22585 [Luteolibacter flavescens]|uniref:Uncharacterized protein n=1 Tax=Luteolibacter flavescens TaxID=1859460 RepID=A0ABT3FWD1_9BACT|nr:hypothetical protein [Luteolibacter flavescens]MCW1887541.1 hypothetical protein [Luteolibacter flavescens]